MAGFYDVLFSGLVFFGKVVYFVLVLLFFEYDEGEESEVVFEGLEGFGFF